MQYVTGLVFGRWLGYCPDCRGDVRIWRKHLGRCENCHKFMVYRYVRSQLRPGYNVEFRDVEPRGA